MKDLKEYIKESRRIRLRGMDKWKIMEEMESMFDGYAKMFADASEILYNLFEKDLDMFTYLDEFIEYIAENMEERCKQLNDKDLQILRSAFGNGALLSY